MKAPLPNASSKPFNTDEPFSTYYSLIPGYWLQLLAFTFMYTLCKVTSTMYKYIFALPAEPQEHSLSKSPKPKCDLARLLNTFLLYVVAVRELFLVFCLYCVCFVYKIYSNEYLWRFNICTKLVWYTFNGHIQRYTPLSSNKLHCQWVLFLFCFNVLVLHFCWIET